MSGTQSFRFGVAILAAGASRRMQTPKLLLPWADTTVVGRLFRTWTESGASQVVIVCAQEDLALQTELDRLQVPRTNRLLNPNPEMGMFISIRIAAAWPGWSSDCSHVAIALGDQPHLQSATLRVLMEASRTHPASICQPSHGGKGRHPVVFPVRIFEELARSNQPHLKAFLDEWRSEVLRVEVDDSGLDLDLDYPEDYERALRLFGGARHP